MIKCKPIFLFLHVQSASSPSVLYLYQNKKSSIICKLHTINKPWHIYHIIYKYCTINNFVPSTEPWGTPGVIITEVRSYSFSLPVQVLMDVPNVSISAPSSRGGRNNGEENLLQLGSPVVVPCVWLVWIWTTCSVVQIQTLIGHSI